MGDRRGQRENMRSPRERTKEKKKKKNKNKSSSVAIPKNCPAALDSHRQSPAQTDKQTLKVPTYGAPSQGHYMWSALTGFLHSWSALIRSPGSLGLLGLKASEALRYAQFCFS